MPPSAPSPRTFRRSLLVAAALLAVAACDADDSAATLSPATDAGGGGGANRIELQVLEGAAGQVIVLVPVLIDGEGPFGFALDTGSSLSFVDSDVAEQVGLEVTGSTGEVTGVIGSGEAELVQVDAWSLGERIALPATELGSLDLPDTGQGPELEGLLGSDVLSSFGTIFIDFEEGVLVLDAELAEEQSPRTQ